MKHSSALPVAWIILRILSVINWIVGALILGLLAASYQAEAWTWKALGVGSVAGHEDIVAGMRCIMAIGIAAAVIVYFVFRELLRMVESVRSGEPFIFENVSRLRAVAWALLALQLMDVAVAAIASAVSTEEIPLHMGGEVSIAGWLAVLLLFVLAHVFAEGSRMRADLEGTV